MLEVELKVSEFHIAAQLDHLLLHHSFGAFLFLAVRRDDIRSSPTGGQDALTTRSDRIPKDDVIRPRPRLQSSLIGRAPIYARDGWPPEEQGRRPSQSKVVVGSSRVASRPKNEPSYIIWQGSSKHGCFVLSRSFTRPASSTDA